MQHLEMALLNRMKFWQRFVLLAASLFFSYSVCAYLQFPNLLSFFVPPHQSKRSVENEGNELAVSQVYQWNQPRGVYHSRVKLARETRRKSDSGVGTQMDSVLHNTQGSHITYDNDALCDDDCTKWRQEQFSRRQTIHNACAKYDVNVTRTTDMMEHILVSDKYKVLYCYIPKVACTNWKKIILTLNGKKVDKPVHSIPIPNLSKFTKPEAEQRLRDYRKVIIARNPHSRLLSAYKEKMVSYSTYTEGFRKHFGRIMHINNIKYFMRKYYPDSPVVNMIDKIEENGNTWVSFQEFVRYVSNTENNLGEPPEEHWREIYKLCNPCAINYDFIGKLSTISEDTHQILNHIGAQYLANNFFNKSHPTNSSSDTNVEEAFGQVTEEDIVQFEKRFEKDMALFGYERPAAITRLLSVADDVKLSMGQLEKFFRYI